MVHYNNELCSLIHCSDLGLNLLHCIALQGVSYHCNARYCTALHFSVFYIFALHYIVLHCSAVCFISLQCIIEMHCTGDCSVLVRISLHSNSGLSQPHCHTAATECHGKNASERPVSCILYVYYTLLIYIVTASLSYCCN